MKMWNFYSIFYKDIARVKKTNLKNILRGIVIFPPCPTLWAGIKTLNLFKRVGGGGGENYIQVGIEVLKMAGVSRTVLTTTQMFSRFVTNTSKNISCKRCFSGENRLYMDIWKCKLKKDVQLERIRMSIDWVRISSTLYLLCT